MSNVHEVILRRMVKTASKQTPVAGHRVRCEVWRNGELVSFGTNRLTHFNDERYMKNPDVVGMHAEVAALLSAETRPYEVVGATVYVARAKKTQRAGIFVAGLARPCTGCMRALRDFGVAVVHWTNDHGADAHYGSETFN